LFYNFIFFKITSSLSKNVQIQHNLKDSWSPLEINELDELERLQALKQRENLLKGLGVKDMVNKILTGKIF
jgi:hypothetical protein